MTNVEDYLPVLNFIDICKPIPVRKSTNILNVVNASCRFHILVTIGEFLTGIKFCHRNKCEIAFSQSNYLAQHQIHSMQKAYECIKYICTWEDSVLFYPLLNAKESMPRRSHSSVAKVTDLPVGVQVFFIIRISTPDHSLLIMQMEKMYFYISGFTQHQNIGEKILYKIVNIQP